MNDRDVAILSQMTAVMEEVLSVIQDIQIELIDYDDDLLEDISVRLESAIQQYIVETEDIDRELGGL